MESEHTGASQEPQKVSSTPRVVLALLLGLLGAGYGTGIVLGYVPESRRIDAASLAMLTVVAIGVLLALQPDLFDRLKRLEMSGFKVEMLERVREQQSEQAVQIRDMALMLPLLLPLSERKHLLNLAAGGSSNTQGTNTLRSELRRLRSFDLLRMRPGKHVESIKDGGVFDLTEFVELTELGKRWARRITEIEKSESETGSGPSGLDKPVS